TTIGVCTAKHSPGATTLAVAIAAARALDGSDADCPTVVIEADPAGGDLAARSGLPFDPGVVSLAADARHPGAPLDLMTHSQPLPGGGRAVLAPASPDQAAAAVASLAKRLPASLAKLGADGVI